MALKGLGAYNNPNMKPSNRIFHFFADQEIALGLKAKESKKMELVIESVEHPELQGSIPIRVSFPVATFHLAFKSYST